MQKIATPKHSPRVQSAKCQTTNQSVSVQQLFRKYTKSPPKSTLLLKAPFLHVHDCDHVRANAHYESVPRAHFHAHSNVHARDSNIFSYFRHIFPFHQYS